MGNRIILYCSASTTFFLFSSCVEELPELNEDKFQIEDSHSSWVMPHDLILESILDLVAPEKRESKKFTLENGYDLEQSKDQSNFDAKGDAYTRI